jgi:DNA primase
LLDAHELAVKYYQASLVKNQRALEYVVKKRKLSKQTIREFGIGYAPDSWEALSGWLMKKGFTAQELLQAGLAGQKAGRSSVYDWFRGRVMFPICDREGRPIAFTARVLDSGEPKYINTPQTPLYDKSQAIFGWHLAREAIRSGDEVVLVEGQMDVVASHQAGVKQVVAASGTALTLEHLRALSKLTKNIKLAFDADRAGLAATERAIELGQKLGLMLRMVELPEGVKDADELLQRDVEAWRSAIRDAKYIVDYLFDRFAGEFDVASAVGKRGYTDRLAATIRRLGDPVEQDHYIKLLAERTGSSEEAVRAKLSKGEKDNQATTSENRFSSEEKQPTRRAVVQAEGKPGARQLLEESLLGLMLMEPDTRVAGDDLEAAFFTDERRQTLFAALKKQRSESTRQIAGRLTELRDYVNILLLRGEQEFDSLAPADRSYEAFGLARRLQMAGNKDLKKSLSDQLREAESSGDAQLVRKLLREYQALLEEEV